MSDTTEAPPPLSLLADLRGRHRKAQRSTTSEIPCPATATSSSPSTASSPGTTSRRSSRRRPRASTSRARQLHMWMDQLIAACVQLLVKRDGELVPLDEAAGPLGRSAARTGGSSCRRRHGAADPRGRLRGRPGRPRAGAVRDLRPPHRVRAVDGRQAGRRRRRRRRGPGRRGFSDGLAGDWRVQTAAFIDSTGGDGWAYLTDDDPSDRLIRLAIAEQADEIRPTG
jgi:hypothetical protein